MKTSKVKTAEPFKSLFSICDDVYDEVKEKMKVKGFKSSEPILLWKEEQVVIDGHTRLAVAKELSIKDVPTIEESFSSEDDALEEAWAVNKFRRHISMADKFHFFRLVDKREQLGGDHKSGDFKKSRLLNNNLDKDKSHLRTAKILSIGADYVSKMRLIVDYCDNETIEEVENDEMSITEAHKVAKERRKEIEDALKAEGTFNSTNDNIEWARWSWNPVTGCKHGCKYCYARDIANRFYTKSPVKKRFDPTFHEDRLSAPVNTKIPKGKKNENGINNVFVCSMADLFGEWVDAEWIEKILDVVDVSPQWNYIFLTKNPKRYGEFDFPTNCVLGATADTQARATAACKAFDKLKSKCIRFLSCEPLEEKITLSSDSFQYVIIGGRSRSSGMEEAQPKWEWVEHLLWQARGYKMNVHFKPNLTVTPKEFLGFDKR